MFEEFKASAVKEGSDVYVVNGDEAVEGERGSARTTTTTTSPTATWAPPRAAWRCTTWAATSSGAATQALNLTYCVSSSSFGTRYSTVVSAMNSAAAAWESTAGVNFIHSSSYDSACTASQTGVLFDVRQVSGAGYLARAFFPNSSRSARNVLIDSSAFGMHPAPGP